MNRRTFFKALLAFFAGAQLPAIAGAKPEPEPKRIFIQRSPIAGAQYYDAPVIDSLAKHSDTLTLKREPHNPYDKRAVAIYWRNHKIGYIPRRENRIIAQMMDAGEDLQARLAIVSTAYPQWADWEVDVEVVG